MSKIIRLDKNLANQIAAWEVVERPLSVVKELVENSIDAWADMIKIEIKNGWIDEIIVSDNWEWIESHDLELTTEKYTTSKIKSLDDLYSVMTFWFRWEALAAISSISKFDIVSKYAKQDIWYSFSDWKITEAMIDSWTKIIVRDLFYNTPARLNYLKKARTEYNHILWFINNISLSYPEVWFELISDEKEVIKLWKNEDLKTRIYSVHGSLFSDNLLEINHESVWLKIIWFVSDPKVSFPNRNRQSLFVNRRVISSPLIYKAVFNAYNRFIPHWNFPAYVINIEVDPSLIDVNVHPKKQEVRFADESNIFRWVYHAIESKLNDVSLIKEPSDMNIDTQGLDTSANKTATNNSYYTWSGTKFKSYTPYKDTSANPAQSNIGDAIKFSRELLWNVSTHNSSDYTDENLGQFEQTADLHDTAMWKIIGQTFNSYIIVETKNSLKILDQHALAERIIYEKLVSKAYNARTQWLLISESLNLTSSEEDILKNNKEVFENMWFDFEIMSNSIVMVNWVPDFIKKENLRDIFLWVLDDIWEENFVKSKTLEEVRNKIRAYMSCRSAIKFWNKLSLFEMNKLLNDSVLDYSATCPHGRPVIFEVDLDELKWKYER